MNSRLKAAPKGPVEEVAKGASSISVIIPFLDEKDTLEKLVDDTAAVLTKTNREFEIILVDDGSSDGTTQLATELASSHPKVKLISFSRNFGKAAALSAGFANAVGDIFITMDADYQDDPKEIPRFLEMTERGFDVVSGWKKIRNDPVSKTLPSKVFNYLTAKFFKIDIHDINCGFKAYSRRSAESLNLYGDHHRFTPALLHARGYKVGELDVQHHQREFGRSKYGGKRFIKGILDIITVKLVTQFNSRPLHFFALVGLPIFFLGILIISYLSALWLLGLGPIGDRPLLLIGVLLVITGTQMVGTGLLGELFQSSSLKESDKYVIDNTVGFDDRNS